MNVFTDSLLSRTPVILAGLFSFVVSSSVMAADGSLLADVSSSIVAEGSLLAKGSLADQKMWKSIDSQTEISRMLVGKSAALSLTARLLELDEIGFKSLLNESRNQNDNSTAAKATNNVDNSNSIFLPLPNGSEAHVKLTPAIAMSAALAQQNPNIKIWKVSGVSEDITGVIDFNEQGFHGMLFMPDGDRVFIEPDAEYALSNSGELSAQGRYISFSKKQNHDSFKTEFSCGVLDDSKLHIDTGAKGISASKSLSAKAAPDLITYRLAVAATGEFTQVNGGSVSAALASIVTTISRVNEIYSRDFGIQFELIDEQSDIIYTNPDIDPYTNSDVFKLITENDLNLSISGDSGLSKDRYDVGHVFGAGNVGGLAVVGGVCTDEEKAFGATGISSPFGDAFALDYVAHELGHQLGGTHTFNSACGDGSERSPATAVEPGSGTTIMAYPGICQENDLQNNVDPQFHVVSIDQVIEVTRTGSGSNCGVSNATINENPTVNAGIDMVVPARTPLVFIAEGADTDNDDLTYSWEQSDTGTVSDMNIDTGDNALFRSRLLSSNNVRFIPRLSDLFAGTPSDGELLPISNREINMVATVRDGNGGLQADLVKMQVSDEGDSFSVTSNTSNQSFGRQDTTNILWNVASTNLPPISCANVDIGVVTSDGNGFNIVTTENDGQQQIKVPDSAPAMNDARFIVSCTDSNFFNVSSGIITIIDQVGGGSIGAYRPIDSNIFSASDGSSVSDDSSGGGGSFGMLMLLWSSLLIYIRGKPQVIR